MGEGGFEASLITTFSIYLPFYEESVLPRLRSSGCRYNIVLADAAECSAALASSESRPRFAGREYVLCPVRSTGAFHPKVILLAGRTKFALAIGSHNLTLAGFGYNRELTTRFRFKTSESGEGPRIARLAWQGVWQWVSQQEHAPKELQSAVLGFRNYANWLDAAPTEAAGSGYHFVAQTPRSGSLWSQVEKKFPKRVRRIIVLGPFFDKRLALLAQIAQAYPKVPIVVGVDPKTVELSSAAASSKLAEFRDASTLHRETGYLHAKALYFDTGGSQDVLIIGSANPSAPAWLGGGTSGNDEAVVVQDGNNARETARELGLGVIPTLPKLSREKWKVIGQQRPIRSSTERGARILIVAVTEGGFTIPVSALEGAKLVLVTATGLQGETLAKIGKFSIGTDTIFIPVPTSICRLTAFLVVKVSSGAEWLALVHHSEEIRDLSRSSKQTQLRAALSGLGSNTENVAKLIATIEKVIFDEPPVSVTGGGASTRRSKQKKSSNGPQRPESLATTMDAVKTQRHRRILETGDLAYLLDALFRQLGIGLVREEATLDDKGRSEEEQVDKDDADDTPKAAPTIDDTALAKLCRGKVSRLVDRLGRQMEQAARATSHNPIVLLQLVAVLAILRELRSVEKNARWLRIRETLVDRRSLETLLEDVLAYLFGRKYQLYQAIVDTLADERFDELARMKGLLIWLAWECDVNIDDRFSIKEDPDDVGRRLHDKAALLEFAMMLKGDPLAQSEASASILRIAVGGRAIAGTAWLAKYSQWADRVAKLSEDVLTSSYEKDASLRRGDLAVVNTLRPIRLRVVAEVTRNRVVLVDFGEERGSVTFLPDRVVRIAA